MQPSEPLCIVVIGDDVGRASHAISRYGAQRKYIARRRRGTPPPPPPLVPTKVWTVGLARRYMHTANQGLLAFISRMRPAHIPPVPFRTGRALILPPRVDCLLMMGGQAGRTAATQAGRWRGCWMGKWKGSSGRGEQWYHGNQECHVCHVVVCLESAAELLFWPRLASPRLTFPKS